jgi:hypothetical protein
MNYIYQRFFRRTIILVAVMSLAIDDGKGLHVQRVIDPRTNANSPSDRIYNVFEGAADISYQQLSQDGGVSNTSLTFTLNPPSPSVFGNRRVMIALDSDQTFVGTSAGPGIPLLQCAGLAADPGIDHGLQHYDAPRAYPLAKACTTVSFSLGNDRLAQNLGVYWGGMNRYNVDNETQDLWHSMTPDMLDQSQSYADLNGFARDPLRGYGDNALLCPRGGFVNSTVIRNDSTGNAGDIAVVRSRYVEMLDLSPFLFEKGRQDVGLIGIQNQSMTLVLGGKGNSTLSGLAGSFWSHSPLGSVLSASTVQITAATVYVSYLTPDAVMPIPRSMNYNYHEITYLPTSQNNTVAPGGAYTVTQNNIQLNSIPSRIMFWVAPQDAVFDMSSTDTAWGIDNINVSFDNRDSLLANASQLDLYQICVKNKTNLSWRQFTRDVGSFIALDFGEDIPLRSGVQAPGLRGTFNLRLTVKGTNLSSTANMPTLNLITITEGVMAIVDGVVTRNIGVLTKQDVLDSRTERGITYRANGSAYGGAWYDDVWAWTKRLARPAINIAKAVLPGNAIVDAFDRGASAVGVGLAGGRKLTRQQLARLQHQAGRA